MEEIPKREERGGDQIQDQEESSRRNQWEEEMYWTHFQFTHFCISLPSAFLHSLEIPAKFSVNSKHKLPASVTMTGPGGANWTVGLTTGPNDAVMFGPGWREFALDNSLRANDLLVFKYDGGSRFDVLIIDGRSSCEKAAPYFAGRSVVAGAPLAADDRSRAVIKRRRLGSDYDHVESSSKPTEVAKEEERKRKSAMRKARLAETEGGFIAVMKASHICRKYYLSLPLTWMKRHLGVEEPEQAVILRTEDGGKWPVKFRMRSDCCRGGLSTGWRQFAFDNNLRLFDVCLFQIAGDVAAGPDAVVSLDVKIFRCDG
ncbi:unnamed protein product [Linum tenue]|uniref:TF-B3 domain-containing protein n=1 Tax=Linum tenue TaxID=586396 RepID=A0AAV0NVN8_9ROSI|nr:unnamed protein product [Linum tenue]